MSELTPSDSRLGEPRFHIETISTPDGGEVSFSPERGGIITSLKLNKGKDGPLTELLYLDMDTFNEPGKNVKGGVPPLVPNAGPLGEGTSFPMLKQHGFARDSAAWFQETTGDPRTFLESLDPDNAMKEAFPYEWHHSMGGTLEEDGSFTLRQRMTNRETEKAMPLSMGLHPYFRVDPERKNNITFDFPGGKEIEDNWQVWAKGGTVRVDNPKAKDPKAVLRVGIPDLGTIVLDVSREYKRIWVWSQPGKGFVCVEPVMRDAGGLDDDPEMVPPNATFEGRVNIRLE